MGLRALVDDEKKKRKALAIPPLVLLFRDPKVQESVNTKLIDLQGLIQGGKVVEVGLEGITCA